MLKGQCPKIKVAICDVLINADDICKVVLKAMDNNRVAQACIIHNSQRR